MDSMQLKRNLKKRNHIRAHDLGIWSQAKLRWSVNINSFKGGGVSIIMSYDEQMSSQIFACT